MFCPLCHAEYVEGVGACASCACALLPGDAARPARVVWRVDHRELSRQVLAVLHSAGVPCHHKSKYDHWVYAVLWRRPEFQVWILKQDMARAHDALVGMPRSPEFEEEAPEILERPVLHCPFCGAEYPEGYSACPGCGIDLTAWMETPFEPEKGEPGEIIWKGGDLVSLSRVVDRLQSEGIPFTFRATHEHLAFELGMPRARWMVQVYGSDAPRALELIADVTETFPLVAPELEAEAEAGEGAAEESGAAGVFEENGRPSGEVPFNPAAAGAAVWSGNDATLAQSLRIALREVGIESWTVDAADGTQRIWVSDVHRERARRIAAEVSGESQPVEP